MKSRLGLLYTTDADWARASKLAEGLSHAENAMACEQDAKNAILDHFTAFRDSVQALALEERRSSHASNVDTTPAEGAAVA